MGAMAVLWSFLGVLKHLLAPPLRCPCLLRLKKIIILHLFLGVPAATVGGTGTPWHTRGYAPGRNARGTPLAFRRSSMFPEGNSGLLVVPRIAKSTKGGITFSDLAPKLWNSLPDNVRGSDTLSLFLI